MLQTGLDQREGHAGIPDLAPAKAHALLQHPRNLGHVAIGIRVRCTTTDHNKAGVGQGQRTMGSIGLIDRLLNTARGGGDHFGINAQFAAILHGNAMFGTIGVQDGRNIVLGMHRRKEHAGHSQYPLAARCAQSVQTIADDGICKLQIAIVGYPVVWQIGGQLVSQRRKFINGGLAARSVTTYHDTGFHAVSFPGLPQRAARVNMRVCIRRMGVLR